jgi:uncharacterized membrane protein
VNDSKGFFEFINSHRGIIIGIGIGFLIGILILSIGFFKTLFLAICVGIGAFFGTKNKLRKRLFEILDKILPNLFR